MTGSVNSYTTNYKFKLINFNTGPWHDLEWSNWREVDALIYTYFNIANVQGIWANSTAYTAGQRVIDAVVSRVFQCDVNHTSAATPTTFSADRLTHPTYWSDIGVAPEYLGAWATTTAYLANQYVSNGHQYAVCVVDHTSGTFATDVTSGYWEILADLTPSVNAASASASAASASELAAAASEATAISSASTATTNAGLTAADVISTAADRIAVAADKLTVAADALTVAADKGIVAADKATVAADKATVASDKSAANTSAGNAATSETNAAASAVAAAASASSINLPSPIGKSLNYLRQKITEDGFEYRTPAEVRSDIGAGTGSGSVTSVVASTGLTGGTITVSGTIAVDVGTTANKIVQLDGSAKLPAIDGSQLTNLPASAGSPAFKNLIIGGDFTTNPWQRGTSFPALGGFKYFADRWLHGGATSVWTFQQTADAPTTAQAGVSAKYCLEALCTSGAAAGASDVEIIRQKVEAYNFASLGWGSANATSVTLSFWVKSNVTGTYSVRICNAAIDRVYITTFTVNASATWEKKTITFAGDTTGTWNPTLNGVGLDFHIALLAGSTFGGATPNAWGSANLYAATGQVNAGAATNNYFRLALVQLEAGTSATSFEALPVDEVLARCMRYFETCATGIVKGASGYFIDHFTTGLSSIPNNYTYGRIRYKVVKRATATISYWGSAGTAGVAVNYAGSTDYAANSATTNSNNEMAFETRNTSGSALTANTNGDIYINWQADAEL